METIAVSDDWRGAFAVETRRESVNDEGVVLDDDVPDEYGELEGVAEYGLDGTSTCEASMK